MVPKQQRKVRTTLPLPQVLQCIEYGRKKGQLSLENSASVPLWPRESQVSVIAKRAEQSAERQRMQEISIPKPGVPPASWKGQRRLVYSRGCVGPFGAKCQSGYGRFGLLMVTEGNRNVRKERNGRVIGRKVDKILNHKFLKDLICFDYQITEQER